MPRLNYIPARFHTFVEIDHEIISTAILLPSADSREVVVNYKGKYVHKVLVNRLVKLAQEKGVVWWTDCPNMTIAVDWDVKHQTKQTNSLSYTQQKKKHIQYSLTLKAPAKNYLKIPST